MNKNRAIYRFIGWFFLANALFFWLLGSSYLVATLGSASLFQNASADFTAYSGRILIVFFALVNYCSYMMLLAFIPAVGLFILAFLYPFRRFIHAVSVCIATLSVLLLIMDSRVYALFKFHLNTTLLSMVFSQQWRGVFDFSMTELMLIVVTIVAVIMLEIALACLVWKKIVLAARFNTGKTIVTYWLGGVLFSYFTLMLTIAQNNNLFSQQTPNLPLYNQLFVYLIPDKNAQAILLQYSESHFSQPLFSNAPLHYPQHPLQCKPPAKPYNIILIMVDSLRFDSLQPSYMPNVMRFSKKAWQFKNHLSGGNSTQPGLFSLFYALPGSYWTAALEQKKPPIFMDVLRKYGYSSRIIWSAEMQVPPHDRTIYLGVEHLEVQGAPGDDVGDWDRHTTKQAIEFLTSQTHNEPFFLNLFYDAAHGYCRHQSFPARYQPSYGECSRIAMSNDLEPLPFYNRYLNAVSFVDDQIAQVLSVIESKGYLNNSIVIFTADHGQEFNDSHQNYWGHASNYTSAQLQVPLLVYWPGEKPRQIDYLTSSYDVVPTLLERLFACSNPVSDYGIGQNLLSEAGRLPFILAGSYVNMGIIEPDRLTALDTSGRIRITDTHATPILDAKPRMPVLKQALVLMRKYYAH